MEKLELLSAVDLFAQLGPSDLALLAEHAEFYDFADGESVYAAGTPDRELFVIDSGSVRIVRRDSEGRQIDLARFVTGESFGEQDFLSDTERTAGAISEGSSRVLVFPRRGESLDDVMMEHPALFARVLHQFMVIVAGRIRSTNALVSQNSSWIQDLRRQVYGDKLTGLLSRSYLDDELPGILSRSRGQTGFLMIKPDNFKDINDGFGHETGDQVLRVLADRLKSLVRESDIAVRYRGNEYAVILPLTAHDDVIAEAERLQHGMETSDLSPVLGDSTLRLTFSVGVSVYPDHSTDAQQIVASAHEAVFAARDAGGHRVVCPDCSMEAR
ncbi:MAG: GGDEF domain-containing protein [Spirochaetaceae bacterium]|nr:MAG: GGDEF domain-containing protein [Spirochaetaceae bacterium]